MRRTIVISIGVASLMACGDDSDPATDGGIAVDGGRGTDAGTTPDAGPRPEGGTDSGVGVVDAGPPRALVECDPYAPGCAGGEKCSIVIDPDPVRMVTDVYFGCVPESTGVVSVGLSCDQSVDVPGTDDIVTHSCAEGGLCIPDPFRLCRALCGTPDLECERATEYCGGIGLGAGVCFTADACDALAQTGCAAGEACRLILNTFGDLTTSCFELRVDPAPLPVGASCVADDDCEATLACSGTLDGMGGFNMGDEACRELCDVDAVVDTCAAGTACSAIPLDPMAMVLTATTVGLCFPAP